MKETVFVSGSSRGIGRAIALDLADNGYNVVLHCVKSKDAVTELCQYIESHGGTARILQFDVNDRAAAETILLADVEQFGCYYGVVCSAGIARDNAFPAMNGEDWDAVIQTNLNGFYNVVHPLIFPMIQRRQPGRIIALSSVSGIMGNRGQVNYSASKAGLIGACKALAIELAKRKITVNCVAPGLIDTEMLDDVIIDEAMKIIPAKRLGKPEEVAATVRFLLSAEAAYITRQVIAVNGGMC